MFVFVGICVLCAVSCGALPVRSKSLTAESLDNSASYITDFVTEERHKRAIARLIAILLGKSKLIFQIGKYRQFSRHGGYDQASKDFHDLNPQNIQNYKHSIHGQVENTEVILYKHGRTGITLLTSKPLRGGKSVEMEVDAIRYLD